MLDAHADKLLADPEAIVQRLVDAVDRLFTEHYRELIPLWDMKKGLAATRKVILDEWTSLVDILAATSKGKGTTSRLPSARWSASSDGGALCNGG